VCKRQPDPPTLNQPTGVNIAKQTRILICFCKLFVTMCLLNAGNIRVMMCRESKSIIIGHKSCNTLSLLNKLAMQKKLQNVMKSNVFWTNKNKNNNKSNIKNPFRNREMTPRPLVPKVEAVTSAPQSHLLKSSYLTVSTQWVKT